MNPSQSLSESFRLSGSVLADDQTSLWGFTEALRPYLKEVVRSQLHGRLPRKFDASDVVQSALAKAVENLAQFEGDSEEEWKAWLAKICQNESKNAIRHWLRQRRNSAREQEMSDPAGLVAEQTSASGHLNRQEVADQVLMGISQLDDEQQLLIQWRHFEDLSHQEIAERLGISVEASKKRWQTTLVKLKTQLRQIEIDRSL